MWLFLYFSFLSMSVLPLVSELKKERKVCYMKSFRVVPKRKEKEEAEEVAKNTGKGGERRAEARLLL